MTHDRWRCLLCGQEGLGGVAGLQSHYNAWHRDEGASDG